PDEYAGAYIDEANKLHIILTKPVDAETEYDYQAIIGYDETVIFEVAKYPLTYLHEVQNALDDVMSEFGICATELNEYVNKIDVHLFDRTQEGAIVEFLQTKVDNFDEKSLAFKVATDIVADAANTSGNALGGSLTKEGSTNAGTLGFNAYRASEGKYGVVTAAHVALNGTTLSNAMGTTIGQTTKNVFGGTVDAAFIPFPNGILGIGKITQSDQFYGSFSNNDDYFTGYLPNGAYLVVGMSVVKIGAKTGYQTGTITDTSATLDPVTGGHFTDQMKYNTIRDSGDSGGPVFHKISLSGQMDVNVLLGIHCIGGAINESYGSKVWNIKSELGVEPYTYNIQYSHIDNIITSVASGSGSITNVQGMKGRMPDGNLANIKGTAVNSGGKIVAQFNQGIKGDIWIYANSVSGYNTDFYTFAAYNNNNAGDWTQTMCTTLQSSNNPAWIYCGYYSKNNDARYFAIAALYEPGGNAANINIDSVIIVPR
ncbi:MAG: S1 family peptidase, partial [Nitrososphaerota archaeon]|nr:S1 family peptidase [Nitrososphaerota archaeon]